MKNTRECCKIVSEEQKYLYESLTEIASDQELGNGYHLISFNPNISTDSYNSMLNRNMSIRENQIMEEIVKICANETRRDMNIATHISSAISSYSRIAIHKMKRAFMKNGCRVCYSDTDSLYIEGKINTDLEKYIGKGLGLLKVEMSEFDGIFIAPKTTFVHSPQFTKVTFKGLPKKEHNSLTKEDFESYLSGGSMRKEYTLNVSKHLKTLSVRAVKRVYSTKFDKNKRVKILNEDGA